MISHNSNIFMSSNTVFTKILSSHQQSSLHKSLKFGLNSNLDCIRIWTLLNLEFVELDSIRIWTVFKLCFYSRLYGILQTLIPLSPDSSISYETVRESHYLTIFPHFCCLDNIELIAKNCIYLYIHAQLRQQQETSISNYSLSLLSEARCILHTVHIWLFC